MAKQVSRANYTPYLAQEIAGEIIYAPKLDQQSTVRLENLELELRKALRHMQYVKIRPSGDSDGKHLFFALLDGPSPVAYENDSDNILSQAIQNVLIAENDYLPNRLNFANIRAASNEKLFRAFPIHHAGILQNLISRRNYSQTRADLLHPLWYYGFVNDSSITIEISELYLARWARGRIRFGYGNESFAAIDFNLQTSSGLPLAGQNFFSVQAPAGGIVRIPIANLTNIIPSKHPIGEFLHHLVDDPDQNSSMPIGFLSVWHTDQWAKMYERGTLDRASGSFINASIFNNATIEITAADDTRAALMINRVEIELNGNGRRILNREYNVPQKVSYGHPLNLRTEILEYRKHFLLGGSRRTLIESKQYDVNAINNSNVLRNARVYLHESWSRRYGLYWSKETEDWSDEPYGWCSAFVAWCYRGTFPASTYPVGEDAVHENWFWDRRENRKYYICAHPDHINQKTRQPFRYADIGNLVRPGYVCWIRNNGHVNFFIHWLRTRKKLGLFTEAEEVFRAVDEGPAHDTLPGDFIATSTINWFRAIGGNQNGGCVTVGNYAIVNIDPMRSGIIDELKSDGAWRTSAIFWCSNRNLGKYDGFGIPSSGDDTILLE